MNNFIIAVGHTESGSNGCGAVGKLDESNCTRAICPLVVQYLEEKGHTAKLLRIDKGNSVDLEDCYTRVNEAGVKKGNFIVLNKTIMPAILIECLFVDSEDADKYDPEIIAKAIVNGLAGNNNSNENQWKIGWNRNNIRWWYSTDNINKCYYTSKNGWENIDNERYIFDDDGYALQNSWYYDSSNGNWYYLNDECKMVKGTKNNPLWLQIESSCYAFSESGTMYCNCITPDGYKVDESGAWVK